MWLSTRTPAPKESNTQAETHVGESIPTRTASVDSQAPQNPIIGEEAGHVDEKPFHEFATVTGRVYDAESGEGLPGVWIYAMGSGTSLNAVTDEDGMYQFDSLYPGNWLFATGTEDSIVKFTNRFWSKGMTVTDLEPVEGPNFALEIGYSIFGTVTDMQSNPVAGASVTLMAEESRSHAIRTTTTDENGRYRIFDRNNDRIFSLRIVKDGYAMRSTPSFQIPAYGKKELNPVLQSGASIAGHVVDQDGVPIQWASVVALNEFDGKIPSEMNTGPKTLDANPEAGYFRLTSLPPGTYRLFVEILSEFVNVPKSNDGPKKDYAHGVPDETFTVFAGEQKNDVTVRIDYAKAGTVIERTVSGTVRDENGRPIPRVTISTLSERREPLAATDIKGKYTFKIAENRSPSIKAYADGYKTADANTRGVDMVDFELESYLDIHGKVVDAATGQPIQRYTIRQDRNIGEEANVSLQNSQFVSNPRGRFSMEQKFEFPLAVRVRAEGYLPEFTVVGSREDARTDVLLELKPGPVVRGVVVDAFGEPVANAFVQAGPLGDSLFYNGPRNGAVSSFTDTNGQFVLSVLTPNIKKLTAIHPDHLPKTVGVDLISGKTQEVTIQLDQGGTVKGGMYWAGEPVTGHDIILTMKGAVTEFMHSVRTDRNGLFSATGLVPGTWLVEASLNVRQGGGEFDSFRTWQNGSFTIYGNETVNHEIRIEKWNTVVTGHVGGLADPRDSLRVSFNNIRMLNNVPLSEWRGASAGTAKIYPNGDFRIDHLPPVEHIVSVVVERNGVKVQAVSAAVIPVEGETVELNVTLKASTRITTHVSCPINVKAIRIVAYYGKINAQDSHEAKYAGHVHPQSGGTYSFNVPEPGEYTLVAHAEYHDDAIEIVPAFAFIDVQPGRPNEVSFKL